MKNEKGVKLLVLEKKNESNKNFGLDLKSVSGPALHKYAPDIYIIYMCGHIMYYMDILCIKNETKSGYSLMVKFLLAKEKTRVRFPLPAQNEVI